MKLPVASFLLAALLGTGVAGATPLSFSYGGRLTDGDASVKGPVDLELRFYRVASGSSPIADGSGAIVASINGVALDDGVFQVEVAAPSVLSAAQLHAIFDGDEAVYVEVTDKTTGVTHARQRLVSMPFALKVPVDGKRARFGADGKLTVGPSTNAAAGEFLTTNADGNFVWQAPSGLSGSVTISQVSGLTTALAGKMDASTAASGAASGYLSSADWTTFNGKQSAITASSTVNAGSLTTAEQDGVVIKPYGNTVGETGELRFEERTGGNYVGFKAPDSVAADKLWTLPAADGAAGQFLSTNGSGELGWASPSGSGDLLASANLSDLASASTARSNLGLGSAATLDVGTTASKVVQLDGSARLPAVDGSALTSLSPGNLSAAVAVAKGGTGATTPDGALTNLLPAQAGNSGKVLSTDGSTVAWLALNSSNWDAAYSDRLKWDGGATGLNAATGRTSLGLGSAATLHVGTTANKVVQLDGSSRLPAVDGSQLTGVVTTATVDSAGAVMDGDFGANGLMTRTGAGTYSVVTDNSADWDTAYTDRMKWDGGATGLVAATARTSLGLGTSATLDVGTTANKVVQLDGSARLPAVDGSQLTNLPPASLVCPTGYILVPADSNFTGRDFCIMKYEAKKDATTGRAVSVSAGTPWNSSWYGAKDACQMVGAHLVTSGEWMTIARNIEATAINDIDSAAGIQLATGHSDNTPSSSLSAVADPSLSSCTLTLALSDASNNSCALRGPGTYAGNSGDYGYYGTTNGYSQAYSAGASSKSQLRTHILSNGNIIWDLAGNAAEWTDTQCDTTAWFSTGGSWANWTDANLTDWEKLVAGPSGSLTVSNGVGQYAGCSTNGDPFGRGGKYTDSSSAGVFSANAYLAANVTTNMGFRCAISGP